MDCSKPLESCGHKGFILKLCSKVFDPRLPYGSLFFLNLIHGTTLGNTCGLAVYYQFDVFVHAMTAGALNPKTAGLYARLYFETMYEVIYKPRILLNGVVNPVFAFLLKFLHPVLFLKEPLGKRIKLVSPVSFYRTNSSRDH